MITLLANKFPIALSLFSSSLPELATHALVLAMALVLLITLAMALVLAMAGTFKSAVSYLAEAPAYRLAMPHFLHKKSRRHAALLLKQIGPYSSLRHSIFLNKK
jgi:Fe2+ transport system protein B